MKHGPLMIIGAVIGIVIVATQNFSSLGLVLFMSGALFGKGDGVWETLQSKSDERIEKKIV
jgi:nicotinamide riboside transporter PnuC